MAKSKRKRRVHRTAGHPPLPKHDLIAKVIAGLMAVGGVGGSASYFKSDNAEARSVNAARTAGIVDQRVTTLETRADKQERAVGRIDRRTIRTETMMELMLDKAGVPQRVRPVKPLGPEEQ